MSELVVDESSEPFSKIIILLLGVASDGNIQAITVRLDVICREAASGMVRYCDDPLRETDII